MRRASRSFLVLLPSTNATPSRTLLGHLFPDNTNNSFLPGYSTSILLAQDTFLGSGRYLLRQPSLRLVQSESKGAYEALFNSRVTELIAPFLRHTTHCSRIHWPYEENTPKEEVYGDDQCRVQ